MDWYLITDLHWANIESNRKEEVKMIECNTHPIYISLFRQPGNFRIEVALNKHCQKQSRHPIWPSFWWSTIVNHTIVSLYSDSGSKAFIILLLLRPSVPSMLNRPPKRKDQRVCSNRQFAFNYICSLNTSIFIRDHQWERHGIMAVIFAEHRSSKMVYPWKVIFKSWHYKSGVAGC